MHAHAASGGPVRTAQSQLNTDDIDRAVKAHCAAVAGLDLVAHLFGVNDTYLYVDDQRSPQLVLRVYRADRRSVDAIEQELHALDALVAKGLRVAAAMPLNGEARQLILDTAEGPRSAVLFPYLTGTPLEYDVADASEFGTVVAMMHVAGQGLHLPNRVTYDVDELLWRPLEDIGARWPHRPDVVDRLSARAHAAARALAGLALPTGLIHGDLQNKNALRLGDAIALIDFDECGTGAFVDDIALFVMMARGLATPDIVAAFLAGYETVRPLTADEHAALDAAVIARNTWAFGWQLRLHAPVLPTTWLDERWLDRNLPALEAHPLPLSSAAVRPRPGERPPSL